MNTATVDSIIAEASQFITQATRLYNKNQGYAPGLTGLEKSLTEIKPFSAVSNVTIFAFIDRFNAYCSIQRRRRRTSYTIIISHIHPSPDGVF